MARKKRLLGKEEIMFTDGETQEIEFYAVSSFEITQLRKLNRSKIKVKRDKINEDDIEFHDDEFVASVISRAVGSQLTLQEIKEDVESPDLGELYRKYFDKSNKEKKPKSSDVSEPSQEQNSQE